jgi:hypothetical protein
MYWQKEVTMNKLSVGLLLAAGLFFIDVSPAAAHSSVDRVRVDSYGYQPQALRRHDLPSWLRRDIGFRRWYERSPLKRYRQIGWNQLFEIYRWERRYFSARYYTSHDDGRRHWNTDRRRYRHDD